MSVYVLALPKETANVYCAKYDVSLLACDVLEHAFQ